MLQVTLYFSAGEMLTEALQRLVEWTSCQHSRILIIAKSYFIFMVFQIFQMMFLKLPPSFRAYAITRTATKS